MIGESKNHNRINGLVRIFSINIFFCIEAVTNEFDGWKDESFTLVILPSWFEYIIFFNPTVFSLLRQSIQGALLTQ